MNIAVIILGIFLCPLQCILEAKLGFGQLCFSFNKGTIKHRIQLNNQVSEAAPEKVKSEYIINYV